MRHVKKKNIENDKSLNKNRKCFFIVIVMTVLAAICVVSLVINKSDKQQIKENALKFMTALNKRDFEVAKLYSTEGSASQIDSLAEQLSMNNAKKDLCIEIIEINVNGEKAVVKYRNDDGDTAFLHMVNEHNNWLVKFTNASVFSEVAGEYVSLGLPSGTLWKNVSENGFYKYDVAVQKFGSKLPTKRQMEELAYRCRWIWDSRKHGFKVIGRNGNSIFLPAAGYKDCDGSIYPLDFGGCFEEGKYWSSTPDGIEQAWCLDYGSESFVSSCYRCVGQSVRLVQVKKNFQQTTSAKSTQKTIIIPPVLESPVAIQKNNDEKTTEERNLEEIKEFAEEQDSVPPPKALFPGSKKNNQQGGSQGHVGSPYGGDSHYKGGTGWSLKGRTAKALPEPSYNSNAQGKVVVKIWVDRNGNVTRAEAQAGSTVTDASLKRQAEQTALKSKFSPDPNATELQPGTITYNFRKSE